jgi:hypothetical protein
MHESYQIWVLYRHEILASCAFTMVFFTLVTPVGHDLTLFGRVIAGVSVASSGVIDLLYHSVAMACYFQK